MNSEDGHVGWPGSLLDDLESGGLMGGSYMGGRTVYYGWPGGAVLLVVD